MADTTVAVVEGVVAGFVMVAGDEVEQVYVGTSFRGGGIAGVLLGEAERLVAAGGHTDAWLAVVPGNARARRFYERSGWTDAGAFDYEAEHEGGAILVPCRRYTKRVAG
ncbi:GNAT family N-acetyltransferase [Actinoplanes sp. Pm04-4]|uniref:GNAT family N-acetyltransferase n=1 Tax=Paractinoplanes pyxinae TaxID=2997416 RepID=A0ABT4BD69_9ACTN|nr:GNAT family N-acetyltransferase [Actinoplanes pyxinae]MCY1144461.1 GNAT family N-acetyltransferase [Actinoplanes pyxinae]